MNDIFVGGWDIVVAVVMTVDRWNGVVFGRVGGRGQNEEDEEEGRRRGRAVLHGWGIYNVIFLTH